MASMGGIGGDKDFIREHMDRHPDDLFSFELVAGSDRVCRHALHRGLDIKHGVPIGTRY